MTHYHNNDSTAILLTVFMLVSTACSTTDETTITAPSDIATQVSTPAVPNTSTAAANPTTESIALVVVSGENSAGDEESAEPAPFTYEYPESLLTNRNDRSTPLGRLCWAFQEYMTQELVRINRILADNTPNWEVTFPVITEGEDDGVGLVGVVIEESNELSMGTDGYMLVVLDEIQEPGIAGIVDDSGLSIELQLFAEAFFKYIAAFKAQVRAVGYENINRTLLPYQDFGDMPHAKEFNDAAIANSDKCVSLSEDEVNRYGDDLYAEIEEYLEATGNIVTIE